MSLPAAVHSSRSPLATAAVPAPKTALEGLRTEIDAPRLEASDFAGSRDQASRSFEAKLGIESPVPRDITEKTEGAFHPLGQIRSARSATGDDGGGRNHARRKIPFNGEEFDSVSFRPNDPVEARIIRAIELSKDSIQIVLYEFTSRGILKALLAAKKHGIKIEIILDDTSVNPRNEADATYTRYRSEQIWALIRDGFDVSVIGRPTKYGINHHKFAVFDGKMLEFGSYNWTYTSEKNHYENVLFSDDKDRVKAYQDEWKRLRRLSVSVAESATHVWPLDVSAPSDTERRVRFNGIRLPAWIFTPSDAFEDEIAAAIDASKESIDIAQFVLESRKIADALTRALARKGMKVRVVADEKQAASEHVHVFLGWLAHHGAQIRTRPGPGGEDSDFPLAEKMHNKFFVFDGKLIETGSANATTNAGINNFENANFIDDKTDADAFAFIFQHMFDQGMALGAIPENELPTDAQMRENALKPRGPPGPTPPGPAPLPAARRILANGIDLPSSAVRPNEPVEPELVKTIDSARKGQTLRIAMYEFEQQELFAALRRARDRGVKIEIVLDRGHVYTTGYDDDGITPRKPKQMVVDLIKEGFDVLLLSGRLGGIMHNKFIIVAKEILEFGSYNYTPQSETDHYENVFFRDDKARIEGYVRYFDFMRGISEKPDLAKLEETLSRSDAGQPEPEEKGLPLQEHNGGGQHKLAPTDPPQETETPIKLYKESFALQMFSPNAGIERAMIRAIDAAKFTIDIAMFSFFSHPIAEALLRAVQERHVAVSIVMDRSQSGTSKLDDWFAWHGMNIRIHAGPNPTRDPRHQKMHNKFMIVDGLLLETGSFNFSSRADILNFENANFLNDLDEIERLTLEFFQMYDSGTKVIPPKHEPKWALPALQPAA